MQERERKNKSEIQEGDKVRVLEHPGCAFGTGTVVGIVMGEPDVRCDKCHQPVIIDRRTEI